MKYFWVLISKNLIFLFIQVSIKPWSTLHVLPLCHTFPSFQTHKRHMCTAQWCKIISEEALFFFIFTFSHDLTVTTYCLNVSTTPLRQWGLRQCFPFSWTTLGCKHCQHPIAFAFVHKFWQLCSAL